MNKNRLTQKTGKSIHEEEKEKGREKKEHEKEKETRAENVC